MEDIRFHYADPETVKNTYGEYDTVDFMINTDRNLINNSVRIEGDLVVSQAGSETVPNDENSKVYFNPRTGIHGVCESISTTLGGGGEVLEFLNGYGRLVNMKEVATKDKDSYFNSMDRCELKVPTVEQSKVLCRGKLLEDTAGTIQAGDFSFKPFFCLNRMSGGNSLSLGPYNDVIKVSINLARVNNFLCGTGFTGATPKYTLSNLRLTYRTLPREPTPNITARSYVYLKQTITGPQVSLSSRVPAVSNAVSISFQRQAEENQNGNNYLKLERPPIGNDAELKMSMNDSNSNFITYTIRDYGEMLEGFLQSFKSSGLNNVNPAESMTGENSFGLGVSFASFVDLRNQKFTFEFKSDTTEAEPQLAYMYFHNLINFN